ncbi:winged helix-turn-helix domain-containing protein [Staphylococcus aureus]|uniref:winged helix-turn-helix domain-containing protein n=1 Tax=Staphylococcus aureus TaxID=1280 RepID=UPI0035230317
MLLKSLYGYVNHTEMSALRVHMASLRKKLNYTQDPNTEKKLIITHPRIGYQIQHLE